MCTSYALGVTFITCVGLAWWCYAPLPEGSETSEYIRNAVFLFFGIPAAIVHQFSDHHYIPVTNYVVKVLLTMGATNTDPLVTDQDFDSVPVRVYGREMKEDIRYPALVYVHGGGWSAGSIETHHQIISEIWNRTEAVIISPDYRLAPEHVYPSAFLDCRNVVLYLIKHAERFKVDPKRIAIAGESAGGNLAAAVALWMRDENITPPLTNQVLIDPITQGFDLNTLSYRQNAHVPNFSLSSLREVMGILLLNYLLGNWTSQDYADIMSNRHIDADTWNQYLLYHDDQSNAGHRPADTNHVLANALRDKITDPYFAPLAADSLRGLPKTFMSHGGGDPLFYDSLLYANRLEHDGVDVTRAYYEHYFHANFMMGFDKFGFLKSEIGTKALDRIVRYLNDNL